MKTRISRLALGVMAGCVLIGAVPGAQVRISDQRQIALLEKARRPDDPWPRGDGHVLMWEPGSPLSQKAYHGPGGSFTPSPGSFGVSIWVRDQQNHLAATSDSIPIEKIQERYVYRGDAKIPSIENRTPYCTATWSYRNGELKVRLAGADRKYAVRPGVNFRENKPKLTVRYE
jgi:hypothetical protein